MIVTNKSLPIILAAINTTYITTLCNLTTNPCYLVSYNPQSQGVNNALEYIIKEKLRDDPSSTSITNLDYSSYFVPQNSMVGSMGGIGSNASLSYDSFDGKFVWGHLVVFLMLV